MAKKWYPVIDQSRCTSCGACVDRCTHGVYDKESKRPLVLHPELCIACMACQRLCPEEAITYQGDVIGDVGCGCSRSYKQIVNEPIKK